MTTDMLNSLVATVGQLNGRIKDLEEQVRDLEVDCDRLGPP